MGVRRNSELGRADVKDTHGGQRKDIGQGTCDDEVGILGQSAGCDKGLVDVPDEVGAVVDEDAVSVTEEGGCDLLVGAMFGDGRAVARESER